MENTNQTIERLLATQKKTVDNLERLNSKLTDLHQALEKANSLAQLEKDLEIINKKLVGLEQLAKNVAEINSKLPELLILNKRVEESERKLYETKNKVIAMTSKEENSNTENYNEEN